MRYRMTDYETVESSGIPKQTAPAGADDARVRWLRSTWLAALPTAGSRAAHERELARFLDWCATTGVAPLAVGTDHADAYLRATGATGLAASTVERRRARLRSFYRAATAAGAVDANPFTRPGPSGP